MPLHIRPASPEDDTATEQIEIAADVLLIERFAATDWPPPTNAKDRGTTPGFVLVAEEVEGPVVGFVHVLVIDGHHLEQLSVHPSHGRRGIGRELIEAALSEARERGYTQVTLRTYADVPWNAPFYASCGFTESKPDSPFLRRLVEIEERLKLSSYGRRVQMTVEL